MRRVVKITGSIAACLTAAVAISACGTQGIQVAKSSPYYPGAVVFRDHCAGCHSLAVVGAEGSASNVQNRVKTDGPDFNVRPETVQQILYAVHNGGYSGEIMPENIVVGKQAEEVARFLAHYAGKEKPALPGESIETESEEAEKAAEKAEESKYLAKAAEVASGKAAASKPSPSSSKK